MKKLFLVMVVMILAIGSISASDIPMEVYGGVRIGQYNVEGLKDTILTDKPWYPTSTGSINLELAEGNGSGLGIGIGFGAKMEVLTNLYGLVDLDMLFAQNKTSLFDVNVGAEYRLVNNAFKLGLGAKIGYYSFSKSAGAAVIIPGTVPPVILEGYARVKAGDLIGAELSGFAVTPFVSIGYSINPTMSIGAMVGYKIGLGEPIAVISTDNDVNIPLDKDGIFYTDLTYTDKVSMSPTLSIDGITASLYVSYSM